MRTPHRFSLVIALLVFASCNNPLGSSRETGEDFHPGIATPDRSIHGLGTTYGGTCAIVGSSLQCWGESDAGSVGNGAVGVNFRPTKVTGFDNGVTAISSGGQYHYCAIMNGGAWCWGDNQFGQLGDGTTTARFTPTPAIGLSSSVTAIATGYSFSLALMADGTVRSWGLNSRGQLGNNPTLTGSESDSESNRALLVKTPVVASALPAGVSAISAGTHFACAIISGGAKCWGRNNVGQLGNHTTVDSTTPVQVEGLTSGVTALASTVTRSCAIKDGGVWCWGNNSTGGIGDGTTTNSSFPVQSSGLTSGATLIALDADATCAVVSGALWCWGSELPHSSDVTSSLVPLAAQGISGTISALSGTEGHWCASVDNIVQCWGTNTWGSCGNDSLWKTIYLPQSILAFRQ